MKDLLESTRQSAVQYCY